MKISDFFISIKKKYFKKYLRFKLYNITTIKDCINIIKLFNTTDDALNNIIAAYNYIKPNESELQQISILHDLYKNNLDDKGYSITTIWIAILQWIIEYIDNSKQKLFLK
jgi:hypothetical protein